MGWHLYMMLRCCPTIGCTVDELEVPRKMFANSIAPHKVPIPAGVVLNAKTTHCYGHLAFETSGCM